MLAEGVHLGRLELLWRGYARLKNTLGKSLQRTTAIFAEEVGPNVLGVAQKRAVGHTASSMLLLMKQALPTQAAVSQPQSQRSECFQLTLRFRDHL